MKPFFNKEPKDIIALVGEKVVFHCSVDGEPKPKVLWRRDDGKMPVGRVQILEDFSLQIDNVQTSDEGLYICDVENLVGSLSAKASLVVNCEYNAPPFLIFPNPTLIFVASPIFIERPQDKKVNLNGVVEFHCAATGSPPPSVFWSKEGSQMLMFPDTSYGHIHINSKGTLRIQGVQREDEGFLVCSALSVAGSSSIRALLQVN